MAAADPNRVADLLALLESVEAVHLGRLKRATDAVDANSKDISGLQSGRKAWERADPSKAETRAAREVGVPDAWAAWTDAEIERFVRARAQLVDARDRADAAARKAVGRRAVIKAYLKQIKSASGDP